jgi:hypothetical protein
VKNTPENDPEYSNWVSLKDKMDALVESINERTRRVQQVQKLADIQDTLEGSVVRFVMNPRFYWRSMPTLKGSAAVDPFKVDLDLQYNILTSLGIPIVRCL